MVLRPQPLPDNPPPRGIGIDRPTTPPPPRVGKRKRRRLEVASEVKPPLGIPPYYIWVEARIEDLRNAMKRYTAAGIPVPEKWIDELSQHAINAKR